MPKKIGIRIATKSGDVNGHREMLLDTANKQLKFRKVINIKIAMPAMPASPVSIFDKSFRYYFNEDKSALPFAPAYDYRMKCGYNGRWGKPAFGYTQGGLTSRYEFPYYYMEEIVTDTYFEIQLRVITYNALPVHTATLRLYVMFDESEYVA